MTLHPIDECRGLHLATDPQGVAIERQSSITARSRIPIEPTQFTTGATAGETSLAQLSNGAGVAIEVVALPMNGAVPSKAVGLQRRENGRLGFGVDAWRVQIVYSKQPGALAGAGVEPGGDGGKQRSEV